MSGRKLTAGLAVAATVGALALPASASAGAPHLGTYYCYSSAQYAGVWFDLEPHFRYALYSKHQRKYVGDYVYKAAGHKVLFPSGPFHRSHIFGREHLFRNRFDPTGIDLFASDDRDFALNCFRSG